MRSKTFIAVVAMLALLGALAGVAVAYDHASRDKIANGIHIAGIDVGGLSRAGAQARLKQRLIEPLREDVVVDHGAKQWRLTANEAKVVARVDASVQDAVRRSRDGGLLSRVMRKLTGGEVHANLDAEVTYSDRAIVRLLDRIRASVDRPAKDASVTFSVSGPQEQDSHVGLAVNASQLHKKIREALVSPTAPRRLSASTHHVEPKVTTDDLAQRYPTVLVVNRGAFRLDLYKNLKKLKSYDIAVGAVGRDTPAGLYHIQNKAVDPAWTKPHSDWVPEDERGEVVPGGSPQNPLKARWLGIFDGAGIHGIDPSEYGSIGHAASHGCVRMRIPDVEDLYDRVPVGAPIYIGG